MSATCRDGHESTELDYCSVCGAQMPAPAQGGGRPVTAGPLPASAPSTVGGGPSCPQCGEPRADVAARFCEVCRFDFVSGSPGGPPAAAVPVAPAAASPSPAPAVVAAAPLIAPPTHRWELILTVDPSLDEEPDPASPPPKDPERIFPVEVAEMLVGRRDDRQNIRPSVPLNDPGASRRHAKFLANADDTVSLQDLASMNGTKLNGNDVVSGSITVLKDGDEVTLGRWSRVRVRRRP